MREVEQRGKEERWLSLPAAPGLPWDLLLETSLQSKMHTVVFSEARQREWAPLHCLLALDLLILSIVSQPHIMCDL